MVKNIIVISDTHSGCQLALCPPKVVYDNGGEYVQSPLQGKLWQLWEHFWHVWVPDVTKGEPYIVVHNGDCVDGKHHDSTTQITQNLTDQGRIAIDTMRPIVSNPLVAGYYHIRGTEAHVGKSGATEEALAQALGAIPDEIGNHARWELYLRLGNALVHFSHHIGSTQSAAYESTAVYKELIESYTESGRWKDEPPDVVVRSHRHRHFDIRIATDKGYGISTVTPGWQLKTPFTHRLALGRTGQPQIGGILIRAGDEDPIYTRFKVWRIQRPKEENVNGGTYNHEGRDTPGDRTPEHGGEVEEVLT